MQQFLHICCSSLAQFQDATSSLNSCCLFGSSMDIINACAPHTNVFVTCACCIYFFWSVLHAHALHVHTVGSYDLFTLSSVIVYLCCHPAAAKSSSGADFEFSVWTLRAVAIQPRLCFVARSTANCHLNIPSMHRIKTVKFK